MKNQKNPSQIRKKKQVKPEKPSQVEKLSQTKKTESKSSKTKKTKPNRFEPVSVFLKIFGLITFLYIKTKPNRK